MRNPLRRRSPLDLSPGAKVVSYVLLIAWSVVVLFPLYWLAVTSLKLPVDVDRGPFYVPFVDFQPTLDAWENILFDLGNDTLRPYVNTVIIGLTSAVICTALGASAAYALVRFDYRPRVALIILAGITFVGAYAAIIGGVPWPVAVVSAIAVFLLLAQAVGRRFPRALGNGDIAFWLISQRILPPIAIAIPLYVLFQQVGLLDSLAALVITYVAANLPIVVWLMREYFMSLPRELEESAAVDGASVYQIVRSIVLAQSSSAQLRTTSDPLDEKEKSRVVQYRRLPWRVRRKAPSCSSATTPGPSRPKSRRRPPQPQTKAIASIASQADGRGGGASFM